MMFFGVRRDFALQARFFKHYDVFWCPYGILHCKCASSSTMMFFVVRRDFALQGCCFKRYDVFGARRDFALHALLQAL